MSSILRALKKLENEPRHQETNQGLDSKFVPLADRKPPKNSARPIIMVLGGGLVCGLVILAGWLLFFNKPPQSAPSSPDSGPIQSQSETAPKINGILPGQQETAADSSEISGTSEKKVPETPVASMKSEAPLTEPTSVPQPQPSSTAIGQKEAPAIVGLKSPAEVAVPENPITTAVEPAAHPEAVDNASLASDISLKEPEKIEIPLLEDSNIKLQAITWSKDPQKRIAVINNSILRQGEAIADYRIDVINQDDVVLSNRGSKWKLLFRIR